MKSNKLKITDKQLNNINQIIEYNHLRTVLNKDNEEFTRIKQFIEKEGAIIYKENDFFKDLHNLMNNNEFKQFYNKYFTNWVDIEVMMMYMKLYETIKHSYQLKFNHEISYSVILFMLRQIIRNNETRRMVMDNFELFKKGIIDNKKLRKIKKIQRLQNKLKKTIEELNTK